jgi:hypothetical protein
MSKVAKLHSPGVIEWVHAFADGAMTPLTMFPKQHSMHKMLEGTASSPPRGSIHVVGTTCPDCSTAAVHAAMQIYVCCGMQMLAFYSITRSSAMACTKGVHCGTGGTESARRRGGPNGKAAAAAAAAAASHTTELMPPPQVG